MVDKKATIKKHQLNDKDTGSIELQIACLTERINHLVEHLKKNKKDAHTRNGLLKLVGRRKRFIKYLQRKKPETLKEISKKLKLKVK